MTTRLGNERGLTLTEVMIVAVIGVLVLIAMGGFYLQSQGTWLDGSSQAITQRELTFVLETIGDSTRAASRAVVSFSPDSAHCQLALCPPDSTNSAPPSWYVWWNAADSLLHSGTNPVNGDAGPLLQSKVERFAVSADARTVSVSLRAHAATGQEVENTMSAAMLNRATP